MEMPTTLEIFLSTMSDADANKIWTYLAQQEFATEHMIRVIVDTHPNLMGS